MIFSLSKECENFQDKLIINKKSCFKSFRYLFCKFQLEWKNFACMSTLNVGFKWRKVAILQEILAKSGYLRDRFGEKVAIFQHTFGQDWRQKWRFCDPKSATSKKYFWKPWQRGKARRNMSSSKRNVARSWKLLRDLRFRPAVTLRGLFSGGVCAQHDPY